MAIVVLRNGNNNINYKWTIATLWTERPTAERHTEQDAAAAAEYNRKLNIVDNTDSVRAETE